jgi:subtilisin family serine protease
MGQFGLLRVALVGCLIAVACVRGLGEAGGPPEPRGQIKAIIVLKEQADVKLATAHLLGQGRQKAARAEAVTRALKIVADRTQGPIRGLLVAAERRGDAGKIRPLWIFNGIGVTATPQVLWQISERPEVEAVIPDYPITVSAPPSLSTSGTTSLAKESELFSPLAVSGPATWNVTKVRAPELWAQGYTGKNPNTGEPITIAIIDTGVDVDHPDLITRYRGYQLGHTHTDSWIDYIGGSGDPYDDFQAYIAYKEVGHGTEVAGIAVGRNISSSFGVAPEANFIVAKIFDSQGNGDTSVAIQALQWAKEKGANIINNSWGWYGVPCPLPGEPDLFQQIVENINAAEIVALYAAGNEGPGSGTIRSPARLASAPAIGGTYPDDGILSLSSRGPSPCNSTVVKPDLVAPGIGLKSAIPRQFGLGDYTEGFRGTSGATPHVAGGAALLLSARPNATFSQLASAAIQGAKDLGPYGKDNDYGFGLLDLVNTLKALDGQPVNQAVFVSATLPTTTMTAGASYPVTVTVENRGTSTWTAIGQYALGSQSPENNTYWGNNRAPLPSDVYPGRQVTFSFNVIAPTVTEPTTYYLQGQMIQENVEWFGDLIPLQPVTITVVASGGTGGTYTLSGQVKDTSGLAMPGVTMTLSGQAAAVMQTDGYGRYTFTSLAPGTYSVTPSYTGYTFSPVNQTTTINDGPGSSAGLNFVGTPAGGSNNPPNTPSNPNPPHGATGVSTTPTLSWTGGDPDPSNTVTYDVYFGTTPSPPLVTSNQAATSYTPGTLSTGTTYYWRIVARDNLGATTSGPTWSFTTTGGGGSDG